MPACRASGRQVFGASLNAIYEDQHDGNGTKQTELPIYGGGRVGVAYKDASQNIARYSYELTDHLGNVRAVIEEQNGGVFVSYYADYYPFGWTMPERNGGSSYRYAYQACLSCLCRQGQEKDAETAWEAFELRPDSYREYDGRVGRWMTTDPYSQYHSPYLAMGNNPVSMIDPDGGCTCNDPPTALATIPLATSLSITPPSKPSPLTYSKGMDASLILNHFIDVVEYVSYTDQKSFKVGNYFIDFPKIAVSETDLNYAGRNSNVEMSFQLSPTEVVDITTMDLMDLGLEGGLEEKMVTTFGSEVGDVKLATSFNRAYILSFIGSEGGSFSLTMFDKYYLQNGDVRSYTIYNSEGSGTVRHISSRLNKGFAYGERALANNFSILKYKSREIGIDFRYNNYGSRSYRNDEFANTLIRINQLKEFYKLK